MALVVRFILPGAVSAREDVFVAGAGLFARGVLDIPAGDANALSAVRAAVGAMATEVGTVDNSVTPPPVQGTGNPYPQYLTLAGAAASVQGGTDQFSLSLKAAYVPFLTLALNPDMLISGTITRNSSGAATAAPVTWPDGTGGTYTADVLSATFPGAVDAYHVTYAGTTTKTYTQPAVTRDSSTGAVTQRPALVVS